MKNWKRASLTVLALLALLFTAAAVSAQQERGSIRGAVYQDVDGDGQCVETGVSGETPVAGITIEFVSSDGKTVQTLQTGSDGTYGLVAAGQSYWEVTAKPDPAKWIVTSPNPLFAPVFPENGLVQTGYNFCIAQGANAIIILPESGASAARQTGNLLLAATAVLGVFLFTAGAGLELARRR